MPVKLLADDADDMAPGARTSHEGTLRRQCARDPAARTYARALPIVPVRARGLTIEGADGRRYLDCLSGAGALALGHNHPVVLEAIRRVLDSGAPLNVPDLATPVKDAFVAELFRTLPPGLADRARLRFCGPVATDALQTACELVSAATGRTSLITFTGAGRVKAAEPPQEHRCPFGAGDERGADLAARWAGSLLDGTRPGVPRPAGVIVEPVQGEGEVVPVPDAWLRRMRRLTADRSVPLIVDETQTGVGRTGAFWAVEHSGVTPDVMILSRAIGGSLPLAVVVYRDDLDVWVSGGHGDTFPGNQLAMAAGTATLVHVRENDLAERAADLGARMLSRLQGLTEVFACVGDVRGRGLMMGLELVRPEGWPSDDRRAPGGHTGPPTRSDSLGGPLPAAPELAATIQSECLRRGLIVGLGGRHSNVVRLLPPLTITDEQAAAVLERLADAVGAVARRHGPWATPPCAP
ncbi:aminotransferase class III-fold pyridoxal phosphate-dependent enzyme [Streptomyces sp. NPDC019990]|uniref:aminotransferase class III-fold pyridoxal phosphate-dependent enzyme n=1 Tax=Streptomyces sp. NPDC019990 TaxID=3154693 RepID=UPI0033C87525